MPAQGAGGAGCDLKGHPVLALSGHSHVAGVQRSFGHSEPLFGSLLALSLPHGHQRGRGPHGAAQSHHQVPPAAVAQGQLDLDVLQGEDALGAGGGIHGDGEPGADVPVRDKLEVRPFLPSSVASVQHRSLFGSLCLWWAQQVLTWGHCPLPGDLNGLDRTLLLRPSPCPRRGRLHQQPRVQQPVAVVVAHWDTGATQERDP